MVSGTDLSDRAYIRYLEEWYSHLEELYHFKHYQKRYDIELEGLDNDLIDDKIEKYEDKLEDKSGKYTPLNALSILQIKEYLRTGNFNRARELKNQEIESVNMGMDYWTLEWLNNGGEPTETF